MSSLPPPSIAPIEASFSTIRKTIRGLYRNRRLFKAANSSSRISSVNWPGIEKISGNYFVSGDKGIFAIIDKHAWQLTDLDTFGIAVRGGELFAATSTDDFSSISKCVLPEKIAAGKTLAFREIFRTAINKSGRIHQIAFYGETLGATLTSANSIIFLDGESGAVLSECAPFRDAFGEIIRGDHNHINSLSQSGDCLLFCAYRAGATGMIGVVHENRVKGYPARNRGAHDVSLSGDMLYYSDTFGGRGKECGFLMANNSPVDKEFFEKPPGYAIRGFSQTGDELILGHSHKGPRAKRFDGNGALFRLVNGKVQQTIRTPFAQVYDIVRADGKHFEKTSAFTTWQAINQHLETVLGPAIYERELK